jgi:hypothetical protein
VPGGQTRGAPADALRHLDAAEPWPADVQEADVGFVFKETIPGVDAIGGFGLVRLPARRYVMSCVCHAWFPMVMSVPITLENRMTTHPPPAVARAPAPARPQAAPTAAATAPEADFFTALALCVGLPPADAARFGAATVFTGPAGLPCKVACQTVDGACAARPEILLPLAADGLAGPDVRQLLAVQALLLSEFGWYLGLSGQGQGQGEGLLQIMPLLWMNQPADVAAALDVGNLLGAVVLERLAPPHSVNPGCLPS